MKEIPHHMMWGLSLHHYMTDWGHKGSATGFSMEEYWKTMTMAVNFGDLLDGHIRIMDGHDPGGRVALVVDEWGGWYEVIPGTNPGFLYQQNTLRDAMIAGLVLNIFNNHADRVKMANLAQTVNVLQAVILTDEERLLLTPTYHVMHMYKGHQDARLLPVSFDSPRYEFGGESLPALSVSASQDTSGTVRLSLVNIDAGEGHPVEIDLSGLGLSKLSARILTSRRLQDHNTFDAPEKVKPVAFEDFTFRKGVFRAELPPFSVLVVESE